MSARKLHISPQLALPQDTVTSTMIVYGGKGMGKTNFGSVLAEECAASGLRFAIIDPMGVWWGLRHSEDGKGPGIEVLILGGIHGDIPIEPTGGAVVADLVVDEDANVIIDISRRPDGTMWSIADRVRFVRDYCKRLYQRQGEKRRPLLQGLDEAARFIPQIIRKDDSDVAACMGAIAVLVEEGRNVGIGVCLITQRSARLNKDVAELADCMVAFRTVGPNSRRAVLDWLGEHVDKGRIKTFDEQLRALPRGSALVVSPGWLEFEGIVPMRMRQTFDSSATPKVGQTVRASGPGAKPDLAKYQARMAATIEKAKAEDPKLLQQRIKQLEKELAAKRPPAPARVETKVQTKVERVEVPILKDKQVGALERVVAGMEKIAGRNNEATKVLREIAENIRNMVGAAGNTARDLARAYSPPVQTAAKPSLPKGAIVLHDARPPRRVDLVRAGGWDPADPRKPDPTLDGLSRPAQRILDALAELEALGATSPTRELVCFLAGYAHLNSKGFANAIGALRSNDQVSYTGDGRVQLTADGRALAQVPIAPSTPAELQDRLLAKLGTTAGRILTPLLEAYPNSIAKDELLAASGYAHANSKGFANNLGRLRTLGFVEYPQQGQVRAAPVLFLEGV